MNLDIGITKYMFNTELWGVWKMLTLAEKGGKGGQEIADIGWPRGRGGPPNADITDKTASK